MLKMHTTPPAVGALLDAEIQDIIALKRMAANPRLVDLMRQIAAASDGRDDATTEVRNQQTLPGIAETAEGASRGNSLPNGLTEAAWKAVSAIGRPFTIPDIVESLQKTGFKFVASKPKVAVAAPVKAFLKRGQIRLVKPGIGSEPNQYEFVGEHARNGEGD